MNSFKHYFNYKRMFGGCGVNNVYMAGVREDWVKLKEKLLGLRQYDLDNKLKTYVQYVQVILDKFIDTWD